MKPTALLGALAAWIVLAQPCSAGPASLEGSYRNAKNTASVNFLRTDGDFYYVVSIPGPADISHPEGHDWEGVGIFNGAEYQGVFREKSGSQRSRIGRHLIYARDDGGLEVHTSYQDSPAQELVERWHRVKESEKLIPPSVPPPFVIPPNEEERPNGEYIYVEQLPEAVTKVPPEYPDEARRAGVQGTVMVQARVMEDGTVGATKVVKSIPLLDDAAAACVRQWRFKPALAKGKPVSVWVAVPIKFSLH
jgi:protein TonB